MDYVDFINSIEQQKIPDGISKHLESLWYDKKGDWDTAHSIIQKIPDTMASLIHAYLHRKEGDIWNSKYWYNRANSYFREIPLDEEWKELVEQVLSVENK